MILGGDQIQRAYKVERQILDANDISPYAVVQDALDDYETQFLLETAPTSVDPAEPFAGTILADHGSRITALE